MYQANGASLDDLRGGVALLEMHETPYGAEHPKVAREGTGRAGVDAAAAV